MHGGIIPGNIYSNTFHSHYFMYFLFIAIDLGQHYVTLCIIEYENGGNRCTVEQYQEITIESFTLQLFYIFIFNEVNLGQHYVTLYAMFLFTHLI